MRISPNLKWEKCRIVSSTANIPDSKIKLFAGVLVSKHDCGTWNDLRKIRDATTRTIDPKFRVSKHFISKASGIGKEIDETRETFIQDSCVCNLAPGPEKSYPC